MKFAGARGITRSRVPLIAMLALAASIGLAGCEGDDGKDGATGPQGPAGTPGATGPIGPTGPTGPAGPGAKIEPRESCGVCHADGSAFGVAEMHVVNPEIAISNLTIARGTTDPTDLVVKFNVKSNGSNFTTLTQLTVQYQFNGTFRNQLNVIDTTTPVVPGDVVTPATFVNDGSGNYTITVDGGYTQYGTVPSRYMFRLETATGLVPRVRALIVGDYPSAPDGALVSSAGCSGCHGNGGNGGFHYSYPASGAACTVCHNAVNTNYPRLLDIGHGIHASHGMPSGEYTLETVNGDDSWDYSATYPTYMTNCSVCHTAASGALAKANAMTVTTENCFSCHESMESWEFEGGLSFHENYTAATNCLECHNPAASAAAREFVDVTDFHNGLETERVGIIWEGADESVDNGKKFLWQITGVTDSVSTGKLTITWKAEYPVGTPVNPCVTTVTASAPGFFNLPQYPLNEGGMSMLLSYAQGDDYILGQANAPGQANATTLNKDNTTCAATAPYTATTVINREAGAPTSGRGIIALQGKPLIPVPAGFADTEHADAWLFPDKTKANIQYVRVPTPTYEYVLGTGAKATARRVVADTSDCLGCHVGSLYQHGNTRVDNVTMCIICHNPASSEQNVRVRMGVDTTEAYDGKVGQTYEFKTMLHAIHSAGLDNDPYVVYRTRGIYAWVSEDATLPNWPAVSTPTLVFGGDPAVPQATQPHNLYRPTYPRDARQCSACHVAGFDTIPDQSMAVATTIDAGACESNCGTTSAVWRGQLDDTLQGASAAACTSCHSTTEARGHAYQNGWTPQTFPNGRQTILDTE